MLYEDICILEDSYEVEPGRMVTVRVIVGDYALEEDLHISMPGPSQQEFPDEITLAEGDTLCLVASSGKASGKARTPVKVPKAIAKAATRVARDPDRRTVRVRVR